MNNSSSNTTIQTTFKPFPTELITILIILGSAAVIILIIIIVYFTLRRRKLGSLEIIHNRDQRNSSSADLMATEVMIHRVSSPRMVQQPLYGADSISQNTITSSPTQCRQTHQYVNSQLEPAINKFYTQNSVKSLEKVKQSSVLHKTRTSTDDTPILDGAPILDGTPILNGTPIRKQEHHHEFKTNTKHNCLPKTEKEDSALMTKLASSATEKDINILLTNCTEFYKTPLANNNDVFADYLNVARTQSVKKSKAVTKLNPDLEDKAYNDIQIKYSTNFDVNLVTNEPCDILTPEKKESLYVNYFQKSYLNKQNLFQLEQNSLDNQTSCVTDSKSENICKVGKQHNNKTKRTLKLAHQNARSKSDVTSCRHYLNAQKPSAHPPSKCQSAIKYVNVSSPAQTSEMTDAEMSFFKMQLSRRNSDYENPDECEELKLEYGNLKRVCSASALQYSSDLVRINVESELEDDYLPMLNPKEHLRINEDIYIFMASTPISNELGITNRIVDDDRGENFETEYINTAEEIDDDRQWRQNIDNLPSSQNIDQHLPLPPQCTFRNTGYINCPELQ